MVSHFRFRFMGFEVMLYGPLEVSTRRCFVSILMVVISIGT